MVGLRKTVEKRVIGLSSGKNFRVSPPAKINYQELVKLAKGLRLWKNEFREYLNNLAKTNPEAASKAAEDYLAYIKIRKSSQSQKMKKKRV